MIEVTLNETEIKMARDLAFSRSIQNRQSNVTDLKYSSKAGIFLDYQGICGELAFCRLFNLYPDTEFNYLPGRRPKHDCMTPAGYGIDIKTHQKHNSALRVPITKNPDDVDFYALVVGTSPKLFVVGTIAAAKVFQDCYLMENKTGTWYELPQKDITPIEYALQRTRNHDRNQQIPTGPANGSHSIDGNTTPAMPG